MAMSAPPARIGKTRGMKVPVVNAVVLLSKPLKGQKRNMAGKSVGRGLINRISG
jgi:hypothetical protein